MRQRFMIKFVYAAVLLSPILGAGGGPAFGAQGATNDVRVCNYQAGKIVSLKGPLQVVSRDGVTAGSGGKTALAAAGPCAPVASAAQGGIVTRRVSDQPAVKDAPKKR